MNHLEIFKQENKQSLLNGVYYLTDLPLAVPLSSAVTESGSTTEKGGERGIPESFENLYLKLRTLEGRVYDDEAVKNLPDIITPLPPFLKGGTNFSKEWAVRKNSSRKLIKYISHKLNPPAPPLFKGGKNFNILDVGCGNGWLSNKVAEIENTSVFAIDVNKQELEQAARVFGNKPNLIFAYADIFELKSEGALNKIKFDIIILAGVLMYFPDIRLLIDRLLDLLNPNGEIHIIDNIFYTEQNIEQGRKNSLEHYKQLGVPEMINIVHHHLLSELYDSPLACPPGRERSVRRTGWVNPQILYNPHKFINRIKRKLMPGLSPFYWLKIVKRIFK